MPTIDFTSGYRDATQGSTLKALAQRRAEMAANLAARKTPQINDPWQGAAEVANTISGSIREGRLASQEAAGRQRFAQLLSGGLAPDEIGEAMGLDPETTQMYVKHDWEQQATKSEQDFQTGRDATQHGYDVQAALDRIKADKDAADAAAVVQEKSQGREFTHADETAKATAATADNRTLLDAALRADNPVAVDEAVKRGLMQAEDGAKLKEQISRKAESEITKNAPDTYRPVTPEEAAQWGGDIKDHPANYKVHTKTNEVEPINPSTFSPAEQEKRTYDTKSKMNAIDGGLDELNRALEIAPDVTKWGGYGRTAYSLLPEKMQWQSYADTANATKRFDQITQSNAIKRMAAELSGSDSDKDVQRFIGIMADPNSSLELKRQTIASMIATLQRERGVTRDRLKGITGQDAGEYKYTNPDVLPGDTTAAGGGGGAADAEARKAERRKKYNLE